MGETDVGETAQRVLRKLHDAEQRSTPVRAKDVQWRLGMSNQLLNYHLNRLEDQGLIEVVGEVDVDAPEPAKECRLTVEGAKVVAAASEARQNVSDELEALQAKVGEVNDLQSRVAELEKRVEAVIEHLKEQDQAAQ